MKTQNIHTMAAMLCLIVLALFSGCTNAPAPTDDPASPTGDLNKDRQYKLITMFAVSEWQAGDTEMAQETIKYGKQFIVAIDSGVISTPTEADDYLYDLIEGTDFSNANKRRIATMVGAIGDEYSYRINIGQLDASTTAPLKTIVGWVIEASEDTIRFGSPQGYGLHAASGNDQRFRVELYPTQDKQWAWRLVAANGETLAHSQTYATKWSANRTASRVSSAMSDGQVYVVNPD